jgi:hypothetical protein
MIFCQTALCTDIFETVEEYEQHLLSENHSIEKCTSQMDQIKGSYVEKLKFSSYSHSTLPTLSESVVENMTVGDVISVNRLMERITSRGWALPQRSNFRYSYEQKLLLYNLFMDGEKTGMKKSPEEVELIIRKKFKPDQYITAVQIRSLFSAFARKLRNGTLRPPTQKQQQKDKDEPEEDNLEEEGTGSRSVDEPTEDAYYTELANAAALVMGVVSDWEVGDYVAVRYDLGWYPGVITDMLDDGTFQISCMEYIDKFEKDNRFRWPMREDTSIYERDDMILKINEPKEQIVGRRTSYYYLSEDDFVDAMNVFELVSK